MSRTWVVVPLFNEASVVGEVICGLRRGGFEHVVCVDDASTDGSGPVAAAAGATVVTHPVNLGQGAALQTGLTFALADPSMTSVVTFDADGQHQVGDARDMVRLLESEELDVVLGSRFLDGRTQPGRLKRLTLKAAVLQTNLTTGMQLTDAHNGLRVLNHTAVAALHIRQNRMAHASEIITQLAGSQLAWREHPVHIVYTEYTKSKGQSLWNSVNILTEMLHR